MRAVDRSGAHGQRHVTQPHVGHIINKRRWDLGRLSEVENRAIALLAEPFEPVGVRRLPPASLTSSATNRVIPRAAILAEARLGAAGAEACGAGAGVVAGSNSVGGGGGPSRWTSDVLAALSSVFASRDAAGGAGGLADVCVTSPGKFKGGRLSSGSWSSPDAGAADVEPARAWADRGVGSGVETCVDGKFPDRRATLE